MTETKELKTYALPEEFQQKMAKLLGGEYSAFLESFQKERFQGLRVNPLKVRTDQEIGVLSEKFGLTRVPWAEEGYYYEADSRPGRHPYHEAGVYYIQEPSAMAAAVLLDPQPGDKVLDLCAAPGGKSTQIAGRLMGEGFLLSNEIHPARAKILSQNVERMGLRNVVVTNEDSGTLTGYFPEYFDKIAVDAPCSGEGMFRKDEEARNQWSPENVALCAKRQAEILDNAAQMLAPGGRLVYSTCTFSPEEDEESVARFLERNRDFSVEKVNACKILSPGRPDWTREKNPQLADTFRIWPHRAGGEGHYLAVLKKAENGQTGRRNRKMVPVVKDRAVKAAWRAFAEATLTEEAGKTFGQDAEERLVLFGDQLYCIPDEMVDYKGMKVLRPGLHLGTIKKNRFEPSHGLALYLRKEWVKQWEDRTAESSDMAAFLRGETLQAKAAGDNGWVLMLVDGYSIGWAKRVGMTLKNHYPKGLRR